LATAKRFHDLSVPSCRQPVGDPDDEQCKQGRHFAHNEGRDIRGNDYSSWFNDKHSIFSSDLQIALSAQFLSYSGLEASLSDPSEARTGNAIFRVFGTGRFTRARCRHDLSGIFALSLP
jgi:hypothetical protein